MQTSSRTSSRRAADLRERALQLARARPPRGCRCRPARCRRRRSAPTRSRAAHRATAAAVAAARRPAARGPPGRARACAAVAHGVEPNVCLILLPWRRSQNEFPEGVALVRAPNAGPLTLSGHEHLDRGRAGVGDRPRARPTPGMSRAWSRRPSAAAASPASRSRTRTSTTRRRCRSCASGSGRRWRPGAPQAADRRFEEPSAEGLSAGRRAARRRHVRAAVGDRDARDTRSTTSRSSPTASLFCGDTVLGEGSVFIAPGGNALALYMESLRRLRALDARRAVPGPRAGRVGPGGEARRVHRAPPRPREPAARRARARPALARRAARRGLGRRARRAAPRGAADARGAPREAARARAGCPS